MQIKINKLPKSSVEIEGEIDAPIFETYYAKALKRIGENVEFDGFRKGKVPENILTSKIPEMQILEAMAELALNEHYPKMLDEHKIDALSRPEINIIKLARNNPLAFKIKTVVLPELKLPDYKKIAGDIIASVTDTDKNTDVTDEEVEQTIMDIRKSRAPKQPMGDVAKENTEITTPLPPPQQGGGENAELPSFDDEFVKELGQFENVEDFKIKLKENIKLEKANQNKEKTRLKMVEKIIDDTEVDLPEILVEIELDKILSRMESDITNMGMKFEDYIKHINKTIPDLRKEFKKDGEKKAKLGLILNEISKIENISADEKEVEKEVSHILEHYKDADRNRATIHAYTIITNEKIFEFLEGQK
ncbi:MAG: hypothetical protein M3P22_02645 [bacterium]|nr:hypothetical protein [bacterium]